MILIAALLLALVVHVALGWPWSIAGGLLAGFFSARTGWVVGGVAVGTSWAILVLYNFVVAPAETTRFLTITGGLLGNMSDPMLVGVTVSIGIGLGLLGGTIGGLAKNLFAEINARRKS